MEYKTPYDDFHSEFYLKHNQSRFDHLNTINIDFEGKSILEIGAGIGDHTKYLLNKKPTNILALEARKENVKVLLESFKQINNVQIVLFDIENNNGFNIGKYDICYCYGLLYHLSKPGEALNFISEHTKETLLLETCVHYTNVEKINLVDEDKNLFSQSVEGRGCRPGRVWLYNELKKRFPYVYIPLTQPLHEQFPIDWTMALPPSRLTRAVFIASRSEIFNEQLTTDLINIHKTT
jgi:phospholipid N-methyltransferase